MRFPMLSSKKQTRAGFTLLEVVMSATILGVLARSLIMLSMGMSSMSETGGSLSLLQHEATKAQEAILTDMRRSGLRVVGGKPFPYAFTGSTPDNPLFADHAYVPAPQSALPGEADFGPMGSVVFLRPADMDNDGRPDMDVDRNGVPELDGNGDGTLSEELEDQGPWVPAQFDIDPNTGLVWDRREVSYRVAQGPDGRNYLERRIDGVLDRRVAKDVERLFVENSEDTGYQIPSNALRISLYLRRTDVHGAVYRHGVQWVVSLKNGDLE